MQIELEMKYILQFPLDLLQRHKDFSNFQQVSLDDLITLMGERLRDTKTIDKKDLYFQPLTPFLSPVRYDQEEMQLRLLTNDLKDRDIGVDLRTQEGVDLVERIENFFRINNFVRLEDGIWLPHPLFGKPKKVRTRQVTEGDLERNYLTTKEKTELKGKRGLEINEECGIPIRCSDQAQRFLGGWGYEGPVFDKTKGNVIVYTDEQGYNYELIRELSFEANEPTGVVMLEIEREMVLRDFLAMGRKEEVAYEVYTHINSALEMLGIPQSNLVTMGYRTLCEEHLQPR